MIVFFGVVFSILSVGALVWGIGSAMMNGVRYSSLSPCLFACVGFGIASVILQHFA